MLVLVVVGWFWYRPVLDWPEPKTDESVYLSALEHLSTGDSPYVEPGFFYTPAFAMLALEARRGLEAAFLPTFRGLNLVGAALACWFSLSLVTWRWPWRLLTAIVLLCCSPLVLDGLWTGSVTLLFGGSLIAALTQVTARPVLAGLVVGGVNGLKPLALPMLAVLGAQGLRRPVQKYVWLAVGTGVAALLFMLIPGLRFLPELFGRTGGRPEVLTNISLNRILYLVGLSVPTPVVLVMISGAASWIAWRLKLDRAQLVVLAATTSLIAAPVANPSTFIFSFPAQAVSAGLALERFRTRAWSSRGRYYELMVVAALILSPHGSRGVAATGNFSPWGQGIVVAIPLIATLVLSVYSLFGSGVDRRRATERG